MCLFYLHANAKSEIQICSNKHETGLVYHYSIQANEVFCLHTVHQHMSLVVRKPAFCICENKDADQLHS